MANSTLKTLQSLLAECLASFIFGFAVYCAILGTKMTSSLVGSIVVGTTIGFSGIAIIYAFSEITLAHFNPAITLAAIIICKTEILLGIGYIIAQYIGFILAVCAVLACFPGDYHDIVDPLRPVKVSSDVGNSEVFFSEFFYTAILVYIAFSVGVNPYKPLLDEEGKIVGPERNRPVDRRITAPLCIGFTLGFLGFLGIATSGGAFNPGLTFAPTILSMKWNGFWIYLAGQYGGGIIGGVIQAFLLDKLA